MLASSPVDSSRRRLAAIAIASFAVLYFQIAATRVLSVLLWYHWAFLSISLAMLGLGAPGVWFALRPPSERALPRFLMAAGLAIPAAIGAVIRVGNHYGSWSVVVCMALLLVPLLLLGCAVCQLLLSARGPAVGRMYGADLVGAAVAAAVVMPSLWLLPTPDAIALLGLLPIAAARLLGAGLVPSGLAAAVLVAVVLQGSWLQIGATKGLINERDVPLMHVQWTPTARLSFWDPKQIHQGDVPGWAWGYGTKAPMVQSRWYMMEQDSSAGTPITEFDGDTSDLSEFEYLFFDVTTVGHQVRAPRRVAIVGGGGGRDILCALKAGATDIEVAELNPGVIDAVSGRFGAFSGDIYHCKGVTAHASEGRAFLTRSRGGYDLIQISLIDSWAATAAGAFTLAENNLYTVEAFQLYYARLSDDGLVATSRWRAGPFPLEAGRLVLLNQQALRGLGVEHPERHLLVMSAGQITTVMASKRPFTDAELATARAVAEQRGFELQYPAPADASVECDPATLLRDGPGALARRAASRWSRRPTTSRSSSRCCRCSAATTRSSRAATASTPRASRRCSC
jgi:spermidine synthase